VDTNNILILRFDLDYTSNSYLFKCPSFRSIDFSLECLWIGGNIFENWLHVLYCAVLLHRYLKWFSKTAWRASSIFIFLILWEYFSWTLWTCSTSMKVAYHTRSAFSSNIYDVRGGTLRIFRKILQVIHEISSYRDQEKITSYPLFDLSNYEL